MSEQAKHTPGKWELVGGTQVIVRDEKRGVVEIAKVWGELVNGPPSEEWLANARLIAAAPTLLAALDWFLNPPYPIGSNAEYVQEFREVAEEAIALATPTPEESK